LIVPLMTGTANMSISLDRLSTVPVEFPPLPEQERIVRILDETDELRKLRAQADSRTAALIPALLYEMFGDPQHTRFPVKPLVELVLDQRPITYGILKPGPDIDGGVPYVRVVDIKQDELHVNQLRRTTPEIADQYRRSTLCPGDVLISIRGTVGRNCIVPVDLVGANITQDTARIAPARGLEPMYVAEFLNTAWAQDWMAQRTQGQAVKGINLGDLKKLPVPVPPAKLQRDFVDRAASVRTMQAQQASSGAHLTDLFQSLLHRAFIDEV